MNIAQSTTNENLSIEEKIFLLNKKLEKLNQMFNEEYMNGQSVNTIRSCINEVIKEKETLEKLLISKKRKNRKIIPIKKKSSIVVKMDSNRKNENKITIFENLKINFDGSKGIYEITWRELGDYKFRTFDLDKNLISESSDRDLNLELFLKEFDNEYQTDLYESYLNNEICVTYDVSHLSKTLNKKERKIFKKNINNYRKNNYNNEVISRIFDTKKIAAAAAMVGLTLATLLSGRPSEAKANRNDEKIISESKKDDNIDSIYYESEEEMVKNDKNRSLEFPARKKLNSQLLSNSLLIKRHRLYFLKNSYHLMIFLCLEILEFLYRIFLLFHIYILWLL